jgi:hypothetical protein
MSHEIVNRAWTTISMELDDHGHLESGIHGAPCRS